MCGVASQPREWAHSLTAMNKEWYQHIEEYTTSVNGFINKCIEQVVPKVTMYITQPEAMDYRQHSH